MNGTLIDPKVPLVYPWHKNEPNDFGNEDCVQIHVKKCKKYGYGNLGRKFMYERGPPGLNDADCGESFYGLCEIPKYK